MHGLPNLKILIRIVSKYSISDAMSINCPYQSQSSLKKSSYCMCETIPFFLNLNKSAEIYGISFKDFAIFCQTKFLISFN